MSIRKRKEEKKVTRVYEPLILNFFMVLTKLGKRELNDSAAFPSSDVDQIDMQSIARENSRVAQELCFDLINSNRYKYQ